MSRKTQTILGVLALLLALGSGVGVYWFLGTFATTATVPVPCQIIPAGALISPALLEYREVPRTLLEEPIYIKSDELTGKVAQVPLYPGVVVYRHHAVPLREYRLVDDPSLVVVSLPVNPSRAVGGQIQPGHLVDLWQLPQVRGQQGETTPLTATLVLSDVLVVDVRASQGQAVARRPQAIPGQVQGNTSTTQPSAANTPLQILTVALPVSQTHTFMAWLTAAENGVAVLWVTLAPVVRPVPATASAPAIQGVAETPALTPTPTETPSPTSTPMATATPPPTTWIIAGTGGSPLRVRDKPVTGAEIGALPEGTLVTSNPAGSWVVSDTTWYYVTPLTATEIISSSGGWVSGAYLEIVTP